MPQITHVKKSQQRYVMVPVLDDKGEPEMTTVSNRDGNPATTKNGHAILRAVTRRDYNQPLPAPVCDSCNKDITPGTPYKHISPKSGPYGGRTLNRHEDCPTWNVWEYSSSLSARISQIQHEGAQALGNATSQEDFEGILEDISTRIQELADEKEEAASNMEDGFGHETEQSATLRETAEALSSWADEIQSVDVPEMPDPEEEECPDCDGTGKTEEETDCPDCEGTGMVTPDEPTEEQVDEWLDEARDNATSVLDESPV